MKPYDIIDIIEKTAPPAFAAAWDASGVQVAAMRKEISHIGVMLDPSHENLLRAADSGVEFILAHHPLSMKARFPNREDNYLAILSLLFTRNIWLYSAHSSLDANQGGPVRWLGDSLHLQDMTLLEGQDSGNTHGFGFVGRLPRPLAYAKFCRVLSGLLSREEWFVCGPMPQTVERVACCPGAGNSMLEAAIAAGADLFISGDIKHHTALDAVAAKLRVIDAGHFTLEEEMMRRFAVQLEQELSLPVTFFAGKDPLRLERAAVVGD
ncbi:Nif3-like dinuclear metal center hexameric protein [Desulfovibrio sp. OttesenSCG-928-A18]|nr:Nif3-like dinuclear metal center hexameric protein [Desulfovibrio sp. OttesenSCG-928-A18]